MRGSAFNHAVWFLLALLFSSLLVGPASADTLPFDHSTVPTKARIVRRAELEDWVLLIYPCTPDGYIELAGELGHGLDPYCVVNDAEFFSTSGTLYAIPAKHVKVTDPVPPNKRDQMPHKPLTLAPFIVDKIPRYETETFFTTDKRLVRLGVEMNDVTVVPNRLGLASASYEIALEGSGAELHARYERAIFVCKNGPTIEMSQGDGKRPAPPTCQPKPAPSSPAPSASASPPDAPPPTATTPAYTLWAVGLGTALLGLLGVVFLWRRQRGAEAQPDAKADGVDRQRPGDGGA